MTIPLTESAPVGNDLPKGPVRALKASKVPRRKPSESQALAPLRPGSEVSRQLLTRGNAEDKKYLFKPLRGREKREESIGTQGQAGAVSQVGMGGGTGTAGSGSGVYVQSVKGNFWASDRKAGGCCLLPAQKIAIFGAGSCCAKYRDILRLVLLLAAMQNQRACNPTVDAVA